MTSQTLGSSEMGYSGVFSYRSYPCYTILPRYITDSTDGAT